MATEWVQLRNFAEAELIFDEQETKDILKFFFRADRHQIDAVQVTNEIRNLAQGLFVEAVDASFAMGWIELTFRWVVNPGSGVKKALLKLAGSAARHWFKHLQNQSLANAKIYERVRDQLGRNFRSPFNIIIQAKGKGKRTSPLLAFVTHDSPESHETAWG